MPTRTGWLTLVAGFTCVVAGRVLGIFELFVIGVALGSLVGLGLAHVAVRSPRLHLARVARPPRVRAGDASRVDLGVTNRSRLSSPVLAVTDGVSGTRGASIMLPPLSSGETTRVAYRLPTERRGLVEVGPAVIENVDPFGMARRRREDAGRLFILVLPAIDEIAGPPRPAGEDPQRVLRRPSGIGRSSEDFYALRPYVVGDDLRRVNWPATARLDELMIRQDETPRQGRTTVLLDVRSEAADPARFERMVSAAASITAACHSRADTVRLVSTDGLDTGWVAPAVHSDPISELLAVIEQRSIGDLAGSIGFGHLLGGGAITAVVGDSTGDADDGVLAQLAARSGGAVVRFTTTPLAADAPVTSALIMTIGNDQSFPEAWSDAINRVSGP